MPIKKGSLGNAIRSARQSNHITAEALAEMLDITASHMKHIESEHRMPSVELLFNLAQTLHMSVDAIIFPETDEIDQLSLDIQAELSDCTARELKIMLATIRALKQYRE